MIKLNNLIAIFKGFVRIISIKSLSLQMIAMLYLQIDTIKDLSMKDIKVFFMVLILIIPFFLPAVEMWQVTFVEKPQLIIISFLNCKH